MAPVDRREHRQQRVRGAGPSSVQAAFGFNFGALGAKQASLPPQRSPRRAPAQSTPRGANGSGQRHRSASAQRSTSAKQKGTPRHRTVTPQTGKRKRASTHATVDEEDELSPERDENSGSVEKSRRVARTVSPIRETVDEEQDELSFVADEGASTARKAIGGASIITSGTPSAERSGSIARSSRRSSTRRSKSTDVAPVTPGMLPNGRSELAAASPSAVDFTVIGVAPDGEESDDELASPEVNGTTPLSTARARQSPVEQQEDEDMGEDELSSIIQATPTQETSTVEEAVIEETPVEERTNEQAITRQPAKRGAIGRVVQDEEEEEETPVEPAVVKAAKRGRPRKVVQEEAETLATPVVRKPGRGRNKQVPTEDENDEVPDELSPETERTKSAHRHQEARELSDEEDVEEELDLTPRPTTKRPSPAKPQRTKPPTSQPPRKRQKFSGPKQAISVMRIKGSTVRGITVADTTRTLLDETIDHRLTRIASKMQSVPDRDRRKDLRSEINLSLSFKESLNEKLLDLQDANDVLTANFKRSKTLKRDNADLRRDILALQNSRQDVALEHDDVQARYAAHKAKIEARDSLSKAIFDIEAAVLSGRRRAADEGRVDEGPEIPLGMLIGDVGRGVGSFGGGLLAGVRCFNGVLERAAGWLEGRA